MRAEAEETYGTKLNDIVPNADKIAGGFSQDDGATVRKVCMPLESTPHAELTC